MHIEKTQGQQIVTKKHKQMYEQRKVWTLRHTTKKCHVFAIEKNGMISTWTYKLRRNYYINKKRSQGFMSGNTRQHTRHIHDAK